MGCPLNDRVIALKGSTITSTSNLVQSQASSDCPCLSTCHLRIQTDACAACCSVLISACFFSSPIFFRLGDLQHHITSNLSLRKTAMKQGKRLSQRWTHKSQATQPCNMAGTPQRASQECCRVQSRITENERHGWGQSQRLSQKWSRASQAARDTAGHRAKNI